MLKFAIAFCLVISPCAAQQQQMVPPPEVALQINGIVGTWAQTLVQQGRTIEDLQKQLAQSKAEATRLKDKYEVEPKKE